MALSRTSDREADPVRPCVAGRGPSRASQTVPTGLAGLPPPGPAIPVTLSPHVVPSSFRTPLARPTATSSDTAPHRSMSGSGIPSRSVFKTSAYAITPPQNTADAPGTSVIDAPKPPPVQLSATETVSPSWVSRPTMCAANSATELGATARVAAVRFEAGGEDPPEECQIHSE